ncbi:MAG TPA: hypothetical protein VGQ06_12215 [Gemmatimonadales bacterium]|nr:hypothetical protein [Gemmatimonadales bacterium]
MSRRPFVVLLLATCGALEPLGAQSAPSAGRSDTVPATFSYTASGFVMSQVTEPVDPFYHASGLLHVMVSARVGANIEVPLRLLSEAWSFSQPYQANITSVRLAVRATLRRSSGDSLTLLAGDLWRVRHGQGLALDNFESQGAAVVASSGRWALEGRLIGFGWAGPDDLYALSLEYDSRVALRLLDDSPDVPSYVGSRIVSADARLAVPIVGEAYAEIGRNVDARRWGALAGVRRQFGDARHRLAVNVEYRHYDRDFFRNETNGAAIYFYFVSLTALDKPLHTFQLYQQHRGRHDVVAARAQGRAYLRSWFLDADVETITGTLDDVAYEASIGFDAGPNADLRVGGLNKFLQFPTAQEGMFRTRDRPWWFMKVTIDLPAARR